MSTDVQRFADDLADELNRSIEIDDTGLFPIAVTEQHGDIDEVRIRAVLQRHSDPEVYEHAFSLDIAHASEPVRFPTNATLGSLPRVYIPLRHGDQLHGYLWLIDSPPLSDEELSTASDAAENTAEILDDQARLTVTELDDESSLVHRLLHDALPIDHHDDLVRTRPLLAFDTALNVVTIPMEAQDGLETLTARGVADVLKDAIYARPAGGSLVGFGPESVRLIAGADIAPSRLTPFRRALMTSARRRGWTVREAGTGTPAAALPELRVSGHHSAFAATIARARGVDHLAWSDLGPDIAFFGLPWTPTTVDSFFPGASRLLDDDAALIRESLHAYFRFGGDTARAAKHLAIHRTTLYYRLDKARELLATDWSDGDLRYGLDSALRLIALMDATATD